MFGHEKDARSPALSNKNLAGLAKPHKGTIFLDEIGDMSRPLQAKLLRFLEDGLVTSASAATMNCIVDVRLIAADQSRYRRGASGRIISARTSTTGCLNVVKLLPPPKLRELRQRRQDYPKAETFLTRFNGIDEQAHYLRFRPGGEEAT